MIIITDTAISRSWTRGGFSIFDEGRISISFTGFAVSWASVERNLIWRSQ